jgi:hypothetical protein
MAGVAAWLDAQGGLDTPKADERAMSIRRLDCTLCKNQEFCAYCNWGLPAQSAKMIASGAVVMT